MKAEREMRFEVEKGRRTSEDPRRRGRTEIGRGFAAFRRAGGNRTDEKHL
jgi:hypothetical protein